MTNVAIESVSRSTSAKPDLQGLREALEDVDRQLLTLLGRRMTMVEKVAEAKVQTAYPFRDHGREELVLQRVRHLAVELELDPHAVESLYRLIMEMSISHQQAHLQGMDDVALRVAYQGVEGAYSHLAAQRRYAGRLGGALLTGYPTISEAAHAVRSGHADFALLPIENSTAGSINETYDELALERLTITAEVISQVEHCLIGLPGSQVGAPAGRDVPSSGPEPMRQLPKSPSPHHALGGIRHRRFRPQGQRAGGPHRRGHRQRLGGPASRVWRSWPRASNCSRGTPPDSSRWPSKPHPARSTILARRP